MGHRLGLRWHSERPPIKPWLLPQAVASPKKSWNHVKYGETLISLERAAKAKIKKALQKGNAEVARIRAGNAICRGGPLSPPAICFCFCFGVPGWPQITNFLVNSWAIRFLRTSARVEAVAVRGPNALTMGKVTKFTAADGKSEAASPRSMNLERLLPWWANPNTNWKHWTFKNSRQNTHWEALHP